MSVSFLLVKGIGADRQNQIMWGFILDPHVVCGVQDLQTSYSLSPQPQRPKQKD